MSKTLNDVKEVIINSIQCYSLKTNNFPKNNIPITSNANQNIKKQANQQPKEVTSSGVKQEAKTIKKEEPPKIEFIGYCFSYDQNILLITFRCENATLTKGIGEVFTTKNNSRYKILDLKNNTLELLNLETNEKYFFNKR